MLSDWVYPSLSRIDEILLGIQLQCRYIHVVGSSEEWDIYPHVHDDAVEFCYVLSGLGYYYSNDNQTKAEPGDFFITPPGITHWEKRRTGCRFELVFLNVAFSGTMAEELTAFFNSLSGRLIFDAEEPRQQVASLMRAIVAEAMDRKEGFLSLIDAKLTDLLIILWRNKNLETADINPDQTGLCKFGPNHRTIGLIKQYLMDHLSEEVSLESVAQRFFYHPKYLSSLFKQHTEQTLSEWLLSKRIARAQDLLRSTHLSMEKITRQCGFSSVSHFCHRFKEKTGFTPEAYRKESR